MSRFLRILLWAGFVVGNLPGLLKGLRWVLDIIGWSTSPEDAMGLYDKLDQMPWWIAYFMAFASWAIFFLAPPLWEKYKPLLASNLRWPIIKFRKEAIKRGWKIDDRFSLDVLALMGGLRQAGMLGEIEFYGRPHRNESELLNRDEPREPILNTHWRDFLFDLYGFSKAEDNFFVNTLPRRYANTEGHPYNDIEINASHAIRWLNANKSPNSDRNTWPNFAEWDNPKYELYAAACLFFGKTPVLPLPADAKELYNVWRHEWLERKPGHIAILATLDESLKSAVETLKGGRDETFNPHMCVTKEALIEWCNANNQRPRFLFKYKRGE